MIMFKLNFLLKNTLKEMLNQTELNSYFNESPLSGFIESKLIIKESNITFNIFLMHNLLIPKHVIIIFILR